MYSSLRDYLSLLRHIMQINGGVSPTILLVFQSIVTNFLAGNPVEKPILKQETVREMFIPALTDQGSKSLSAFNYTPQCQWGTAMAICTQDIPDGRRKGTIFCTFL